MSQSKHVHLANKDYNNVAQQFYFDQTTKTVKSVLYRDLSLTLESGHGAAMKTTDAKWTQRIRLNGEFLTNEKGKNLDVKGGRDSNQTPIQFHKANGTMAQRFEVIYLDEEKIKVTEAQVAAFKSKFERKSGPKPQILKMTKEAPKKKETEKTEKIVAPKPKLFFK